MPEEQNDGFCWEPELGDSIRQGDLLWNVPTTVIPSRPTFVLRTRDESEAQIQAFDYFPDPATSEIIAEARWAALTMVVTPTCHVWEEGKDEDIVAVVPVEPLRLVASRDERKDLQEGKGAYHLFYLPPTDLAKQVVPWDAVAQLDRPTSLLKHDLRQYRVLGLVLSARFELRKQLAWFWARGSADEPLDKLRAGLEGSGRPLEEME